MMNGINDELILAARLLLATLFHFGEKADGLFGHRESNAATWRSDAATGCRRSDLHGTSGGARGRHRRVHASRRCTDVFYTLGTALIGHRYDNNGRGSSRQYG
jgi:hypothetical protein